MNVRGLVRELLVAYMNTRKLTYVPIVDFRKEYKAQLPAVDLYRVVYGLGLQDPSFRIEKDEDATYIRMVTV